MRDDRDLSPEEIEQRLNEICNAPLLSDEFFEEITGMSSHNAHTPDPNEIPDEIKEQYQ